jgi:SAM-dependent methyltransferase
MAHAPTTSLDRDRARLDTRWGAYAFRVERAALLAATGCLAGRQVLDVGCGTGRFSAALEAHGAQVTGIDIDPATLTVARERVHGPLLLADAHALPLADASFDVVVSVTATEFLTDPPVRLSRRCVSPARRAGGRGRAQPAQPLGPGPPPPSAAGRRLGRGVPTHATRARRPAAHRRARRMARRPVRPRGHPDAGASRTGARTARLASRPEVRRLPDRRAPTAMSVHATTPEHPGRSPSAADGVGPPAHGIGTFGPRNPSGGLQHFSKILWKIGRGVP